jgi:hypothetical protein
MRTCPIRPASAWQRITIDLEQEEPTVLRRRHRERVEGCGHRGELGPPSRAKCLVHRSTVEIEALPESAYGW